MSSRIGKLLRGMVAVALVVTSSVAVAQIQVNSPPAVPGGVFQAFPAQNPLGPTGVANQQNSYPYPGQCVADPANAALFPLLGPCPAGGSFAPDQRSASTWVTGSSAPRPFVPVNPVSPAAQTKFQWNVINPLDYTPNTSLFPGADYYELGVHEAWGFQSIADVGAGLLFPDSKSNGAFSFPAGTPNGMQWTGLVCDNAAGCSCPADASAAFKATYCTGAGTTIPQGFPLFTPIWGIGQINMNGGPVTATLQGLGLFTPGPAAAWSGNTYIATWPSISVRGIKDRPVVVKWVNEFPNNHVLCPHPEAADWPCAIDRTFMGVKTFIDPALSPAVPYNKVNRFGSPQQPDNSWVTHLHGGEIPPSTDGFAEKWYGNSVTAASYTNMTVNPPFENPRDLVLARPGGNFDTYTYPMVNDEALIWFHDHTLGKTHHNVIAGPAGFFPVTEPRKHGGTGTFAGTCSAAAVATGGCTSTAYTWLDPVTQPRADVGPAQNVLPIYDYFFAIQDRAFNDDGSINFSNGLGQAFTPDPLLPMGYSSVTPGANPEVHPTWVPEYFGDHVLVNGVLWPKTAVVDGHYRVRIANGSDSRCYNIGFSTIQPAPGTLPVYNVPFNIVANDQGYLGKTARLSSGVIMCPGERQEFLITFQGLAGQSVYMVNNAAAPYPFGDDPSVGGAAGPFAHTNVIMRFDVSAGTPAKPSVKYCAPGRINNWNATWVDGGPTGHAAMLAAIQSGAACIPPIHPIDPNFARIYDFDPTGNPTILTFPAGAIVRQMYLNERLDGVTGAPFGMQLNGVPFEYRVTETPRKGSREFWQFINLTVDAHPMHPHFVKHQIVARQNFSVPAYKVALCGNPFCQPGPVPGGEMQVVPNAADFTYGGIAKPYAWENGWKDASRVMPSQVTTIVADWTPRWNVTGTLNAPGTAGCPNGTTGCAAPYVYEDVTTGPYVWHCHINSHEDSEMMRTSLVVP